MQAEVIVIGAGLSGLSCAYELAAQGVKVLVLEKRQVLGGRTSSWVDGPTGMLVESGLHRYLGFYQALPNLLKRAGIDLNKMLVWEDEFELRLPSGQNAVYGAAPLYKPLPTLSGLLGNNHILNWQAKWQLGRFIASASLAYNRNSQELDQTTVSSYAKEHDVNSEQAHTFLTALTSGIFFLPPENYSTFNLIGLAAPHWSRLLKMRIGAFAGGMSEVMIALLAKAIEQLGGKIEPAVEVESLELSSNQEVSVQTAGKTYTCKQVVLATTIDQAKLLLKDYLQQTAELVKLDKLAMMSALSIQLDLTEPALEIDRTTFSPGTVWASYAEQSRTTFKGRPGRLSVIIANPGQYLNYQPEQLLELVIADGKRLGIDLTNKIRNYFVFYEPNYFYSLSPGNEQYRPKQNSGIPGLTLAGDYTAQPYLATMEGAVVAGALAAEQVLASS